MLKAEGIVLNHIKHTDKSRIIKVFTREKGLQAFIAKGISSKKAKFHPAFFEHLSIIDLIAYDNPKKGINLIVEARLSHQFETIPHEIKKSCVFLFINEVLFKCIKEEEENRKLYSFLKESFIFFDKIKDHYMDFHLVFLVQLSRYLGFPPLMNFSESNPRFDLNEGKFTSHHSDDINILNNEISKAIYDFIKYGFACLNNYNSTNNKRAELLSHILKYYKIHISNFNEVKSLSVLKTVLE